MPTFPQPLTVRVRIVDDSDHDYGIAHLYFGLYGAAQLEYTDTGSGCVSPLPDEAAAYCSYDFNVVGDGANMFLVTANAPHGPTLRDCLYYDAIDAATDAEAERVALEARAVACRGK